MATSLVHDASLADGYVEIPVVHRDYSHLSALKVYPLGDVHKGAPAHDATRWREWLAFLAATRNASMIGTGDFLNAAIIGSKSDVYDEQLAPGDAKREIISELRPVRSRIDLLIPGNHEARIHRAVGDCPVRDMADMLDVPYAKHAAVIVYKVGRVVYDVYVRHGTGGGQVGARAQRLQRQSGVVADADVYVSGHTHSSLVFPEEVFKRVRGRMVRHRRYFVSSGSFLRYEGYAASAAYAPTKIGAPRITLNGDRREVHVSA